MGLFRRFCTVLVVTAFAAGPAAAQFGGIFGDPPRPPSSVPSRPPTPPADDRFPDQRRPVRQYPDAGPQQYPPPPQYPGAAANTGPAVGPPPSSGIQSQTLAPPPGIPPAPAAQPGGPGQPPRSGPQQANVPPQPNAPAQANAPSPPSDETVIAPPAEKIVNPTAVFSGLDKITGRITSFDVSINETVQFGALQVTPRACYTRPLTQTQNTDSFVEVDEVTLQGEVKRIFTGWMFAASPGLHGVEHPIYDVWLTDCKGGAPPPPPAPVAQAAPTRPAAAPKAQRPAAPAPRPPR